MQRKLTPALALSVGLSEGMLFTQEMLHSAMARQPTEINLAQTDQSMVINHECGTAHTRAKYGEDVDFYKEL